MGVAIIKDETFTTCLGADVKPTTDIENGTVYLAVDTKKVYIFHNGTWYEQ